MNSPTIEILKRLRKSQLGGIPIKQLQKAIQAAGYIKVDASLQELIDAVLPSLRAQGALNTRNLEARESTDGLVGVCRNPQGIALVTVLCGTDFVALSETMKEFAANIARITADQSTSNIDTLLSSNYPAAHCTVSEHLDYLGLELGEKITISALLYVPQNSKHSLGCYVHNPIPSNHPGITLGQSYALVEINKPHDQVAHNLAMHVFGNEITPIAPTISEIPAEVVAREEAAIAELSNNNVPPEKAALIQSNRLQKRLGQLALLTQTYVKSEKKETVADYIGPDTKVLSIRHFRIRPVH